VDGILQAQAQADVGYFVLAAATPFTDEQREQVHQKVLKAYRWQAPLTYAIPEQPEQTLPLAA
jgi:hypothetical protein